MIDGYLSSCSSKVNGKSVIILLLASIISIVWWYLLYVKRIKAIPQWKAGPGRPPKIDTREQDYLDEKRRQAFWGGNKTVNTLMLLSIIISLLSLILAIVTLVTENYAAIGVIDYWLSIGACTAPLNAAKNSSRAKIWHTILVFGKVIVVLFTMILDWLVSFVRQTFSSDY